MRTHIYFLVAIVNCWLSEQQEEVGRKENIINNFEFVIMIIIFVILADVNALFDVGLYLLV